MKVRARRAINWSNDKACHAPDLVGEGTKANRDNNHEAEDIPPRLVQEGVADDAEKKTMIWKP